jgi:hypothetical protein
MNKEELFETPNNGPAIYIELYSIRTEVYESYIIWRTVDHFYSVNYIISDSQLTLGKVCGKQSTEIRKHVRFILTKNAAISYIILEVLRAGFIGLSLDMELHHSWSKDLYNCRSNHVSPIAIYNYFDSKNPNSAWNVEAWRDELPIEKLVLVRAEIQNGIESMFNLFDGLELSELIINQEHQGSIVEELRDCLKDRISD